ncbi:MAG TPA: hypothetical protein VHB93_00630 [Candidatus Paceibacterota bacterium]|nr:hypothetical protein [Candidatus Paceibacterota bacterium]
MKVVIATPLYPPDIAEPAPYVKALATRLSKSHEVTIVAYGRLPEPVPGVTIVAVAKDRPLIERLFSYTHALRRAAKDADVVIAENGASVELPAVLMALTTRTPFVLHIGDTAAHAVAEQNLGRYLIEQIARAHARAVIEDRPLARPEVIPFLPAPVAEETLYEESWQRHLSVLNQYLHA